MQGEQGEEQRDLHPNLFESISGPAKSTATQSPSTPGSMDLAVAFANLVTVRSDKTSVWVARNGDESIFSVFWKTVPEVIWRTSQTSSDWLHMLKY